jgi:LCP family protein required for cell wall assembly
LGNQKKNSISRIFSFIFFISLGLAGAAMIVLYFTFKEIKFAADKSFFTNSKKSKIQFDEYNKVFNVLVLGIDTFNTKFNGRSDSVMIVSIDHENEKIKITSLMRDTWVKIPKKSSNTWNRLNAAYSIGGAVLAVETIERNFGLKIHKFVSVDFVGFPKIINSLGGINITLTPSEVAYINAKSENSSLRGAGVFSLNGEQTLHHASNRDSIGADRDRIKRQQDVVKAIFEKIKLAKVSELMSLVFNLMKFVKTDFKISEIMELSKNISKYLKFQILHYRLPTDDNIKDAVIGGRMVLTVNNFEKCRRDLHSYIFETKN